MISPLLRAIACVVLILSFPMLSGVVTTVSALVRPTTAADACCDRGEAKPAPMSGPCSDADCLCFSCLTLDQVAPLPYACQMQKETTSSFCPSRSFCPDGFSATIDYPPETA